MIEKIAVYRHMMIRGGQGDSTVSYLKHGLEGAYK